MAVDVIDICMQEGLIDDAEVVSALWRVVGRWRIFKVIVISAPSSSKFLPEVVADDCELLEDIVHEVVSGVIS